MKRVWLTFGIGAAVLAVVLVFVHPLAPLFLLLSLVVQVPLVWAITKSGFSSGYLERARLRREAYEQTGDAEKWLAGEEAEERSTGWKYWSGKSRALYQLAQAEALLALGRAGEAREKAAQIDKTRLPKQDSARLGPLL